MSIGGHLTEGSETLLPRPTWPATTNRPRHTLQHHVDLTIPSKNKTNKMKHFKNSRSWVETTARSTKAIHIRCDRGEENEVR